ncbi:hypothetical protein N7499_006903 [Penicillium canescens]|nr:hypothetical protein N7499_006903 [Penicillium canescens]KAJ6176175.1 hypothetical protein N7485_003089 [Penicillium canescens]
MKARQSETSKGSATSSARIRDNQRRSRTRRKEYVHDLEQRLRSFENLGVKATQEVQAAGKKVATENVLLRSLLMLHGVTETQIKAYLEWQGQPPSSIPPQSYQMLSSILENNLERAPIPPLVAYHRSATSPHKDLNSSPHELMTIGSKISIPESNVNGNVDSLDSQGSCAERASTLTPATTESETESPQSDSRQNTGQFTSCEAAADIIGSMQAHSDHRDVRSELGCNSEPHCMVKNMSIFELLDKSQT